MRGLVDGGIHGWVARSPAGPQAGAREAGLLALACHLLLEPAAALSPRDMALIGAMGLGPLGAAFFLWDRALKTGDPRRIGILSYLTPLASTGLLSVVSERPLTIWIAAAAALIVGAAVVGLTAR